MKTVHNWRYIMPVTIFLSPQFYEAYKSSNATFIILPSSVVIKSESRLCPKQSETRDFNLCEVGIWPWMWIRMHHYMTIVFSSFSTFQKLGGQKQFSVCWPCSVILSYLYCLAIFILGTIEENHTITRVTREYVLDKLWSVFLNQVLESMNEVKVHFLQDCSQLSAFTIIIL